MSSVCGKIVSCEIVFFHTMDEVRVERLIQQYKDTGDLAGEDPVLLMLK